MKISLTIPMVVFPTGLQEVGTKNQDFNINFTGRKKAVPGC